MRFMSWILFSGPKDIKTEVINEVRHDDIFLDKCAYLSNHLVYFMGVYNAEWKVYLVFINNFVSQQK
jgi:hypothetical protein